MPFSFSPLGLASPSRYRFHSSPRISELRYASIELLTAPNPFPPLPCRGLLLCVNVKKYSFSFFSFLSISPLQHLRIDFASLVLCRLARSLPSSEMGLDVKGITGLTAKKMRDVCRLSFDPASSRVLEHSAFFREGAGERFFCFVCVRLYLEGRKIWRSRLQYRLRNEIRQM